MGSALSAITRACIFLGHDRSHPLIEALMLLDSAAGGGGSAPPVFYATNSGASPFSIPARAPLIVVSVDTSGGNAQVVLPPSPQAGDVVRMKSTGTGIRTGTASLSSIGNTIDGSASWPTGPVAVNSFQAVTVMFQPNGVGGVAGWSVISDYGGVRAGP